MEPISATIVTALALGAANALKDVSSQAVRDSYAALKALIQRKYERVPLAQLEENPASKARRAVVQEELVAAGAEEDKELLEHTKAVVDAVSEHAPETAAAIGVDLADIKGGTLRIADVIASGAGVKIKKGEFTGDIDISGVRAGQGGGQPAKKA